MVRDFGDYPDLIIADGGINQINAIKEVLLEYNLNIDVAGLSKDDKHKTDKLLNSKSEEIEISDRLKLFLTNIQEEVHKIAIQYHIKKRDEGLQKSVLDNIKGIGLKRKADLFKKFKTIENMKKASLEELKEVPGITEEIAKEIKNIKI